MDKMTLCLFCLFKVFQEKKIRMLGGRGVDERRLAD